MALVLLVVVKIATNVESISEVQTNDAEPERFKSVSNEDDACKL